LSGVNISATVATRADFDIRIFYGMLAYRLGADLRHWICAIGAPNKPFPLRFLCGLLLDDSRGVLRAGTGILRTIDFASRQDIDAQLVTGYANEAVARIDEFKAQVDSWQERSRRGMAACVVTESALPADGRQRWREMSASAATDSHRDC
jgi:hypothetical protein